MRTQRPRGGGMRSLGAAAIVAFTIGGAASACSSSNNSDAGGTDTGGPVGDTGIHPDANGGNPDAAPDGGGMDATPDGGTPTCNPTGSGQPSSAATQLAMSNA